MPKRSLLRPLLPELGLGAGLPPARWHRSHSCQVQEIPATKTKTQTRNGCCGKVLHYWDVPPRSVPLPSQLGDVLRST